MIYKQRFIAFIPCPYLEFDVLSHFPRYPKLVIHAVIENVLQSSVDGYFPYVYYLYQFQGVIVQNNDTTKCQRFKQHFVSKGTGYWADVVYRTKSFICNL